MRGLLYAEDYKPLFSGHETFALRQMWLTKGYDAATKTLFTSDLFTHNTVASADAPRILDRPGDGHANPRLVSPAFARAARAAGAQVIEHCEVTELGHDGQRFVIGNGQGLTVHAPRLLNCAGAWALTADRGAVGVPQMEAAGRRRGEAGRGHRSTVLFTRNIANMTLDGESRIDDS